jgi:hypothetical protein
VLLDASLSAHFFLMAKKSTVNFSPLASQPFAVDSRQ